MNETLKIIISACGGVILGGITSLLIFLPLSPSSPHFPPKNSHPVVSSVNREKNGPVDVPILVYHIVRPPYPSDSAAVRRLAVPPSVLNAQFAHLKKAGYHVISFHTLENHFYKGALLSSKPIILSFDDAWKDQYVYAFPILKRYGYTATFFVFSNAIGSRGFLSVQNVKDLIAAGMTIGDHSRSHPFLTKIKDSRTLWDEIEGSKKLLEKELGVPINEFAYPFGQYDAAIVSLVKKAGYKSARGDFWRGPAQTKKDLYTLSALNAPTTTARFKRLFP